MVSKEPLYVTYHFQLKTKILRNASVKASMDYQEK